MLVILINTVSFYIDRKRKFRHTCEIQRRVRVHSVSVSPLSTVTAHTVSRDDTSPACPRIPHKPGSRVTPPSRHGRGGARRCSSGPHADNPAVHMEAACTDAMRQPGVIGVMCVDGQGLCLQSQGEVPEVSGCVAEIASQAQVLCQGNEGAVVSVESAERKVLLSRVSGVTTAVFMRPSGGA